MLLIINAMDALAVTIHVTPGTVDNLTNSNCSILEAVQAANNDLPVDLCPAGSGSDIIDIGSATYSLTSVYDGYAGSNGLPYIESDITITGSNAVIERSLQTQAEFRFFSVAPGAVLRLESLTLKNGLAGGTGIWPRSGGAIFNETGAITLAGVTITNNQAQLTGGALHSYGGHVTVDGCLFQENTAEKGGGIRTDEGNMITISNTTFSRNTAQVDGGGMYLRKSNATITDTYFGNNDATDSIGGGITINETTATISHCNIESNTAGNKGGGIRANENSEVTITDSTISGNSAVAEGGGAAIINSSLTMERSTVSGNRCGRGAGLYIDVSDAQLINSTITGNTAEVLGGGIYIDAHEDAGYVNSRVATLNCTITNNTAAYLGGGIWYNNECQLTQTNTINALNSPRDCGGNDNAVLIDAGGNWFGDKHCNGTAQGNPFISPLDDNGGPTLTHFLQPHSSARNVIAPKLCPDTDQRGEPRNDEACDIGAFEVVEPVLGVEIFGRGDGTVTSTPAGIDCGNDCAEDGYEYGTVVELQPGTLNGSIFAGWSGDCTGLGPCMISMDEDKTVRAEFTSNFKWLIFNHLWTRGQQPEFSQE